MQKPNLTKFAALALIIALIGNLLVPWLLSSAYPDFQYNHLPSGLLGQPESPVGHVYQLWLILFGWLMIFGSFAIESVLRPVNQRLALIVQDLLIVFGATSGLIAGFFRMDAPGYNAGASFAHQAHQAASYAGMATLLLSLVFLALYYFKKPDQVAGGLVLLCLATALVLYGLFLFNYPNFTSGFTYIENLGVYERMSMAVACLPYFAIAGRVFDHTPAQPAETDPRSFKKKGK